MRQRGELMKRWRVVALVAAALFMIALVIIKEARIPGSDSAQPGIPTLEETISGIVESAEPSVLVFYAEPADFCCEGTRVFYEDMRRNVQDLVAALEGAHPYLFVDVNSLLAEDRETFISTVKQYSVQDMNSAVVIGADGSKIKEYHAPFDPAAIVTYVQEQR